MDLFPTDEQAEEREQSIARLRKRALVLGVSLLAEDRARIPWFLLLLFIPQILPELWPRTIGVEILTTLLSRVVALFLLWHTFLRHLRRCEVVTSRGAHDVAIVVGLGIFLWLGWQIPILLQALPWPGVGRFLLIAMTIIGIHAQLRLFFFFIEPTRGRGGWKDAIREAARLSERDFWLPVFTLLLPFTLTILLEGLVSVPAPDGRILAVDLLGRLTAGVFWLLATYFAVGAGLSLTTANATLPKGDVTSQPPWSLLAAALRPQVTAALFFLAVLVWSGNFLQLLYLPPAAEVSLQRVSIRGASVHLRLRAEDPRFHLRGFVPLHFALGSETRVLLSGAAETVVTPTTDDGRFGLAATDQPVELELDFQTERPAEELKQLEDVYLWYRYVKLMPVPLKNAEVEVDGTESKP